MQPQVIAGRYEVVRPIGSGGMGTVWLCRDTVLDREVAVKRVGALPGDAVGVARAMREARIAASLNDPHAVGVFDVVDEDDAHWLVMEYVEGQSLAEKIRDEGSLPPTRVAAIGSAVAGALSRAHDRGIVHRDIKPGNILIDNAGTPKISDFGIARAHADDQLTQTGFMTGTPGYLSPELARGGDPTSASDVWALGATLYYAVEGHPPYESQANPLATLQAIARGESRPMEQAGPLGGAIAAMMDPDPQRRWDMATTSTRLDAIAKGDTTLALPAGAALGGAAATELIREPVETTQRLEQTPVAAPAASPPPSVPPARPSQEDKRRSWLPWFVALLAIAVLALAYAVFRPDASGTTPDAGQTTTSAPSTPATTSSSSSSSSSTSSSSSSSTTTEPTTPTPPGDDAALQSYVEQYYKDVTKANKRDDTWAQLTPAMQQSAGGRDAYEQFWSGIKSVDVREVKADSAQGSAIVALTFKPQDGNDSDEVHQLGFVVEGDTWLIDSDSKVG